MENRDGWDNPKEKELFDKFYEKECKHCHSTSCIVKGGWRNPCFIGLDGTNELLTSAWEGNGL